MSRTYKDVNPKYRYKNKNTSYNNDCFLKIPCIRTFKYDDETCEVKYYIILQKAGYLPKLKKSVDSDWHWMTTPMWWIREYHNQPQRAKGKMWEKMAVSTEIDNLIDLDKPNVGRKPHIYFW